MEIKKTADDLPAEQRASYSAIIDGILSDSDLNTVSAKAIRKGLQEKVDYDIAPQKEEITDLIMSRFDKFQRDREQQHAAVAPPTAAIPEPAPTTNGAPMSVSPPAKRKATSSPDDEDEDDSDVVDTPAPRKKPKPSLEETDEQMAKRMQAELNAVGSRATRGGGSAKKRSAFKKKDTTAKRKKKSKAKVGSDEDSDVDGSGSGSTKPEKPKTGGFHKPLTLSAPLSDLLGETRLSRPQTVKKIWIYIRENDLQNPQDKREIRCDEKMRTVFGKDKVHMFTMNKILGQHLYADGEI